MIIITNNLNTERIEFTNIKIFKGYLKRSINDELLQQMNLINIAQQFPITIRYLESEEINSHTSVDDFLSYPHKQHIINEFKKLKFLLNESVYNFIENEITNNSIKMVVTDFSEFANVIQQRNMNNVQSDVVKYLFIKYTFGQTLNFAELANLKSALLNGKEEIDSFINESSLLVDKSIANLQNIEEQQKEYVDRFNKALETQKEQLTLQAPRKHWEQSMKSYRCSFIVFSCILLLITLLFIVFDYFAFIKLNSILSDTISDNSYIFRLSIMITTILSIELFFLNMIAKVVFNYLNLSQDANERVTLIDTYLSMLNSEQNILDETHKNIILQSLYARTENGLLKNSEIVIPFLNKS